MQWKSLSEVEKEKYEDLAREDRARYSEECAVSSLPSSNDNYHHSYNV